MKESIVWFLATKTLPIHDTRPNNYGTQVLIWPPEVSELSPPFYVAFYGTRVEDKGGFYLYGNVIHPTHWAYLPEGPK